MMNTESKVQQRYAAAAQTPETAFCCRAGCDFRYPEAIQDQVIDKAYRCAGPCGGGGEYC